MKKVINNISIVIPVLNEEKNITSLLAELQLTLNNKIKYEILLVDDGSTDNTVPNIRSKINTCHNLKIIVHEKNYGQSIGLRTGIIEANNEYIVTLDGDGQNDPRDILKLIKSFDTKFECMEYTWDNKVDMIDELFDMHKESNGKKLKTFAFYCENRYVKLDEV